MTPREQFSLVDHDSNPSQTMIANYALSCQATTITTTTWSIIAGGWDGTVTILAIVDPHKEEETNKLVAGLPSRNREKLEVNGGLNIQYFAEIFLMFYKNIFQYSSKLFL